MNNLKNIDTYSKIEKIEDELINILEKNFLEKDPYKISNNFIKDLIINLNKKFWIKTEEIKVFIIKIFSLYFINYSFSINEWKLNIKKRIYKDEEVEKLIEKFSKSININQILKYEDCEIKNSFKIPLSKNILDYNYLPEEHKKDIIKSSLENEFWIEKWDQLVLLIRKDFIFFKIIKDKIIKKIREELNNNLQEKRNFWVNKNNIKEIADWIFDEKNKIYFLENFEYFLKNEWDNLFSIKNHNLFYKNIKHIIFNNLYTYIESYYKKNNIHKEDKNISKLITSYLLRNWWYWNISFECIAKELIRRLEENENIWIFFKPILDWPKWSILKINNIKINKNIEEIKKKEKNLKKYQHDFNLKNKKIDNLKYKYLELNYTNTKLKEIELKIKNITTERTKKKDNNIYKTEIKKLNLDLNNNLANYLKLKRSIEKTENYIKYNQKDLENKILNVTELINDIKIKESLNFKKDELIKDLSKGIQVKLRQMN